MKSVAIDLFCGAGGMSEGLLQAGFHVVYASDINEAAKATYTHRHTQLGYTEGVDMHFELADIRNLSGGSILHSIQTLAEFRGRAPSVDAVFGGPPCQGFSRAGRRRVDDPRNMLFKEYLRVVREICPRYVVMENVEGFLDTRLPKYRGVTDKRYPENMVLPHILLKEFEEIGYHTLGTWVLDAADFGVPQRRRRAIFVAYRDGEVPPRPPERSEGLRTSVREAIGDLIIDETKRRRVNRTLSEFQRESRIGRTPSKTSRPLPGPSSVANHELARHDSVISERFSLFRPGESGTQLAKRVLADGLDLSGAPHLLGAIASRLKWDESLATLGDRFMRGDVDNNMVEALLTRKNSRLRLHPDEVAPTMVTLPDDFVSPFEDRILTVREMARLQSFDDSFQFLGKRTTGGDRRKVELPQYTLVGNAVPPLLARAFAVEIRETMEARDARSEVDSGTEQEGRFA